MILHGTTYIDNGFRPAIAKVGTKWTHVVYLDGNKIVCKRKKQIPEFKDMNITLKRMANKFLQKKTTFGGEKYFSKAALKILNEAKES